MIIIGAKGFAKEVLEVLWQKEQDKNIVFFDDVSPDIPDLLFKKFTILKSVDEVKNHLKNSRDKRFTLGIGNPIYRYQLYNVFLNLGGIFTSTISPYAHIGHFENSILDGCNIMTGTVITNSVSIGKGCLINKNCTIGHDAAIGDFVEMSPGTAISGNCKIGNFSVLGANSTILPRVKIGQNVIVGAGAVVTKDVQDNSLVTGIPAMIKKELSPLNI